MRLAAILLAALLAGCKPALPAAPLCRDPAKMPMIWIAPGSFVMGEDPRYREEGPPRTVAVKGFWIDSHELTNREFEAFVRATGYRTVAEAAPPPIAGAQGDELLAGSAVFTIPDQADPRWWRWVAGADWRHPGGPRDSIVDHANDPVVHLALADVEAYARWAGKQLPSEAQWEYAARAGAAALPEPVTANGVATANYYQGVFPIRNLATDHFAGRAPVGCFPPNRFGLYDMIGNVWEWTRDATDASGELYVIKGGSFLCASSYCARYRAAARQFQERGLGTDHIGVRLIDARRAPPH